MPDSSSMDEIDLAFYSSMVPEDGVGQGFLAIAAWIDADGAAKWKLYTQLDMLLTGQLGLLELAKLELIRRCDELEDD